MTRGAAALYRLYAGDGALLYVGVTKDPPGRWRHHRSQKPWWPEVCDKRLTWCHDEREALIAEREAIRTERPRYNRSAGIGAALDHARRVGRPRGPERVALTIRILAGTNERLTAAVEMTGESPQYVVDAALAAYLDALGVPPAGPA